MKDANKQKIFVILLLSHMFSCHVSRNVTFSDQYIAAHKGKLEVTVPEVHELANILVALSHVGRKDSLGSMIDTSGAYFKEVMEYFLPYADLPIMDTINHNITSLADNKSIAYNYDLKINACSFVFDTSGQIRNNGIIKNMGFSSFNPIGQNKNLISSFAARSDFRSFYKKHLNYYNSLITEYKKNNPIDKMTKWLEGKFGFGYGSYVVTFSPLIAGSHATQNYQDNNFRLTYMFVCKASVLAKYNNNVNEMRNSRVVFTEIDHNFVNPLTHKKRKKINKALSDRSLWQKSNGSNWYGDGYAIFNEYMTWSLFSLYCLDNFPEEDVKQFLPKMENQMVEKRNFLRFDSFNRQLIKIYEENRNISMEDLTDKILEWCLSGKTVPNSAEPAKE